MTKYRCSKCKRILPPEEAEVVACPKCDDAHPDPPKRDWGRVVKQASAFGCSGILAAGLLFVTLPLLFPFQPGPRVLLLFEAPWLIISTLTLRQFTKRYSFGVALLSLLWWLLSYAAFWLLAHVLYDSENIMRTWQLKSVLLCLTPGAIIAFGLGFEGFYEKLSIMLQRIRWYLAGP